MVEFFITPDRLIRSIRVGVASPVRLVREGLVLALRGRVGIAELHAFALDPKGLADASRNDLDVVLLDIAGTAPEPAAQALKTACPAAKLVAFALTEIDSNVFACAA